MSLRDGQLGRYTLSRNAEQLAIAAAGTAVLDNRYLRLNASNDPVTGQLAIHPTAAYRTQTRYQRLTIGEADTADNVGIHFVAGATPVVYSVTYIGAVNATASTYNSGPNGDWSVPGRINVLDGIASRATCNTNYAYPSGILRLTINAGTSLPSNAVIVGWRLYVRRQADNGAGSGSNWLRDYRVGMMLGDVWVGDNKRNPYDWTDDWEDAYYGSAGDAWGAGITAANVNAGSVSVGIQMHAYKSGLAVPAGKVDYVELTCYYTLGNEWVMGYDASSGAFSIKPGRAIASYFDFSPSGALTIPALTGVAPLTISSTTLNPNLNADLLDGYHASSFVLTSATHNILSATHADSTAASVVRGDIITGQGATPKWTRLAVGSANAFLCTDGTDVAWSTGFLSITAAKTLTVSNTLTLAGTDSKSLTLTGSLTIGADTSITGGGTLALGGYSLTVPATGTAALGTGAANYVTYWTSTNAVAGNSNFQFDGSNVGVGVAPQAAQRLYVYKSTAASFANIYSDVIAETTENSSNYTKALGFTVQKTGTYNHGNLYACTGNLYHNASAGTTAALFGWHSTIYMLGASSAGTVTQTAHIYCAQIGRDSGSTTSVGTSHGVYIANQSAPFVTASYGLQIDNQTGASTVYGIYTGTGANRFGDKLLIDGSSDVTQLTVTGHTTQTSALAKILRNDSYTNTVNTNLVIGANTTGTAAAGLGSKILWTLESSTAEDQTAATEEILWTDATHASRTALLRRQVTGNAVQTGYDGSWSHSAVADTAITVIPNATGDVTEAITVIYTAAEVTGTDTGGGVCVLEPGDSYNIVSDATNILTLACAADGSVTVQRTAGTDTYKVKLLMNWL